MTAPITFTLDLEDHRPDDTVELRFPQLTRTILERLADRGVRGTFFVVGSAAELAPDLVRDISAAGHEVALHGWRHIPLVEHDAASLREDVTRGKAYLEDLTGQPVVGYRAATFSLVPTTTWATELLAELGFTYSSSVLPSRHPLYGFPGVPKDPFCWPSGLAEFPVPLAGVGRVQLAYLGGTILRVLPTPVVRGAHRRSAHRVPWTYMHPYDIDTEEKYWAVPDAGRLSPLLWVGRKGLLRKLDRVLDGNAPIGPPLGERLDDAHHGGVFVPSAALTQLREEQHGIG